MKIKKSNVYFNILMICTGLNIILNYGFSNFGLRIGAIIIPATQIVMLLGIVKLIQKRSFLISIKRSYIPILLLFLIFIVRVPYDFIRYGALALRDATHYMDMLFVIIADQVTYRYLLSNKYGYKKIWKYVRWIFVTSFSYLIICNIPPLYQVLLSISPVYIGLQGPIRLMGSKVFVILWLIVFMTLFYQIMKGSHKQLRLNFIPVFLVFLLLIAIDGRATIISFIFVIVLYSIIRRNREIGYLNRFILILIPIVLIFLLSGISIQIGNVTISGDYYYNLMLSIFGQGNLSSKSDGTELRLSWWIEIISNNFSSITDFLFGQGFGSALTNFYDAKGHLVREPHNSTLSVFGRMGMVGLILWYTLLIRTLVKSIRGLKSRSIHLKENVFTITMIIVFWVVSLVEVVFEYSYLTMPFYTFLGMFEAMRRYRSINISIEKKTHI